MPRPCPFVSCRHHLYLDVAKRGRIAVNHLVKRTPDVVKALLTLPETCSLDVAEEPYLDVTGGRHMTLKQIGDLLGITRERVRQIELEGLRKVQEFVMSEIDEWLDRWERS